MHATDYTNQHENLCKIFNLYNLNNQNVSLCGLCDINVILNSEDTFIESILQVEIYVT